MPSPLTGRFEGDFSSFAAAVDGVQIKLRGMETDSAKVSTSLARMTDSFSGRQVIQQATLMVEAVERIGGTSQLTEADLRRLGTTTQEAVAKMEALGMQVPANLRTIATETQTATKEMGLMGNMLGELQSMVVAAFSVQAILNFGRAVLDAGDSIMKMSDQTGLAIKEVQQLQFIAGQSGTSMEALISAAQNMQLRLGQGDAGLIGALKKLNINLDDFRKMGTLQELEAISKGMRDIQDPTEFATIGAGAFGKAWKEVAPAVKANMEELAKAAPIAADAAVKATDDLGDSLRASKDATITWGETGVLWASKYYEAYDELVRKLKAQFGAGDPIVPLITQATADETKRMLDSIKPPALAVAEAFKGITLSEAQIREEAKKSADAATASMKEHQATIDAEKKSIEDLKAATESYWKSVGDLVDEALGAPKLKMASEWDDAMRLLNDDVGKLSSKMRDELAAAMQGGIEAMSANGTLTSDLSGRYADLLMRLDAYNQSMKVVKTTTEAVSGTVTDFTRKLYDIARAQDAQTAATNAANAALATQNALTGKAAGPNVGGSVDGSVYKSPTNNQGGDIFQPYEPGGGTTSGNGAGSSYYVPPARANGGPVVAGQSYIVGEKKPELFTPGANGFVSPIGGGVTVQNTFNIVDTEANIAKRVSDTILRSITSARRV